MAFCVACGAALPEGARFCPACATPVAPRIGAHERKLATMLFADLVGSTALASGQDPERTRLLLDRFYAGMAAEIRRVGGTVEKFAGDAVLAVFGAPRAYEDHAERALHAALSMQRRLQDLFGEQLGLRIGVNTGEVVLGEAYEGSSFVSGDAVNVAARLEQAAAPGEILASERTVAAAAGAFEFGAARSVAAKGKAGGVRCRPLVRTLSLTRPRGVGALRRTFVGREREIRTLNDAFRRAVDRGSPQVITIVGEAGVGKTRLVREFWDRVAAETPEALRRVGRCVAYARTSAYQPLGEILKEHFSIRDAESAERVLRALRGREILAVALGLDVAGDLHPVAVRERFREAWRSFVAGLVAHAPTVLLIEDLHWADSALVEVLSDSARVEGPLLLLATVRSEGVPLEPGHILRVEPLERSDGERLLGDLLGSEPQAELSALVARAEGNPFFIEETLSTLIDRGLLVQDDGRWTLGELPPGFVFPDSVHALLAARIDLLPPCEKAALQAGAVLGRAFWAGAVQTLVDGEPDFGVLEDRELIRRRRASAIPGETEYAIRHALTREVAYESIPKGRRAHLHLGFAEWLERLGVARDEHAAVLAHHYGAALRPDYAELGWPDDEETPRRLQPKAVAWIRRAAELAVGRYEVEQALALLERALELAPSHRDRVELWREVGRAHALRFDGERFWRAMERALEADDDPASQAETYSTLAFETASRGAMWTKRPATERVEEWVERALALAGQETPERIRALVASAYWDPARGADRAREASTLADRLGNRELRLVALGAVAAAAFEEGRFEDAYARTSERLDFLPQISDLDRVAEMLELAIPAVTAVGRLGEGRSLARRSDEVAERLSPHHRLHSAAQAVDIEELAGGWADIRRRTALVEERVDANAATPCVRNARSLLICALAWAHGGSAARAQELERAADALKMEGYGYALDPPRVRLALIRGDLRSVARLLEVPPAKTYTMGVGATAARLDGLAALRDRTRVEAAAASLLRPGIYLEPFALRALGVVRGDDALVEAAIARFKAMGLDWHADETVAFAT